MQKEVKVQFDIRTCFVEVSCISAAYYPTGYGHAGPSAHFESQFYTGSFSAGGSATGTYAGAPTGSYPMNMGSMGKSHSVSTAMPNSFPSYDYPNSMQV